MVNNIKLISGPFFFKDYHLIFWWSDTYRFKYQKINCKNHTKTNLYIGRLICELGIGKYKN